MQDVGGRRKSSSQIGKGLFVILQELTSGLINMFPNVCVSHKCIVDADVVACVRTVHLVEKKYVTHQLQA